jgi:GrpB-like predicted nucleotidyltransferase (UPF0157 family)
MDDKKDPIELVEYINQWPDLAAVEISILRDALSARQILDIQHVGSTAIPGMIAKPIIDIQIAVDSLEDFKTHAVVALNKLDYQYWDKNPDPKRMFFVKGMPPFGEKRTHHVHIFEITSKLWNDKILFRDYLRTHPNITKQYENLKKNLASLYTYDREKYTDEKAQFINDVLVQATEWRRQGKLDN